MITPLRETISTTGQDPNPEPAKKLDLWEQATRSLMSYGVSGVAPTAGTIVTQITQEQLGRGQVNEIYRVDYTIRIFGTNDASNDDNLQLQIGEQIISRLVLPLSHTLPPIEGTVFLAPQSQPIQIVVIATDTGNFSALLTATRMLHGIRIG